MTTIEPTADRPEWRETDTTVSTPSALCRRHQWVMDMWPEDDPHKRAMGARGWVRVCPDCKDNA